MCAALVMFRLGNYFLDSDNECGFLGKPAAPFVMNRQQNHTSIVGRNGDSFEAVAS